MARPLATATGAAPVVTPVALPREKWVKCPLCAGMGHPGESAGMRYVRHPFPFPGGVVYSWCWPSQPPTPVRLCVICGKHLSKYARKDTGTPACSDPACRTARVRLLRREDAAYRAALRARERLAEGTKTPRDFRNGGVCTGCGRTFPAGGLIGGVCGGPWCPSFKEPTGGPS